MDSLLLAQQRFPKTTALLRELVKFERDRNQLYNILLNKKGAGLTSWLMHFGVQPEDVERIHDFLEEDRQEVEVFSPA